MASAVACYIPCSSRQQSVTTKPFVVFLTRIEFAVWFVTSMPPRRTVSLARTRVPPGARFAMEHGTRFSLKRPRLRGQGASLTNNQFDRPRLD